MIQRASTTILQGHVLDQLKELPDKSVHMVVTSPPYWSLRSYGDWHMQVVWPGTGFFTKPKHLVKAAHHLDLLKMRAARKGLVRGRQERPWIGAVHICAYGLEPSPELYIEHTVQIFREIWRVLRDDGTLWLNLGDAHSNSSVGKRAGQSTLNQSLNALRRSGAKEKEKLGLPWRIALALQADGWYLRSDIIWHKPNPLPESVQDRPTNAHEYLFQFCKSPDYFYDSFAIRQPSSSKTQRFDKASAIMGSSRNRRDVWTVDDHKALFYFVRQHAPELLQVFIDLSQNWLDVYTVGSAPYKGAHFATFPPDLIKPCILAGTSAKGCCPKCGAPWRRLVMKGEADLEHQKACGGDGKGEYHGKATKDYAAGLAQNASEVKARILAGLIERKTVAWESSCECFGHVAETVAYSYDGKYPDRKLAPRVRGTTIAKSKADARAAGGDHDNPYPAPVSAGWKQPCECRGEPIPCTVLDPFGGSGTTAQVCLELGRNAITIELNPEYIPLIVERTHITPGLPLA